jgi:prevent-host-death family protein
VFEVSISEFKAKCSALVEQVRRTRQPIRITRQGKPVAEIIPTRPTMDRRSMFGSMEGSITIKGDIISPASDPDEWGALGIVGEESEAKSNNKLISPQIEGLNRTTRGRKTKR